MIADVIANHYGNPLISARFANVNRADLQRHVVEFLVAGSGCPQCYTGKDLVTAHKGMNISEQELVAAIDDIVAAMTTSSCSAKLRSIRYRGMAAL